MECGSSISNDGYGQDRVRIMAILAQDANTGEKDPNVPLRVPWDYRHLGELTYMVVTVFAKMASNACGRRCQFPLDMASIPADHSDEHH